MSSHVNSCQTHVGKLTGADTCGHPYQVDSVVAHWHMSEHVGTYQHMLACPQVPTHATHPDNVSEVPRVPCCYMSADDRTCRHMLAGVDTCQHIPGCRHLNKVEIIGLTRTGSVGICQHMSAHISTCRHVHRRWHLPASILGPTDWYQISFLPSQWHHTPLSGNPPFTPGQKHDNQLALSELSKRWALSRPVDKPRMHQQPTGI